MRFYSIYLSHLVWILLSFAEVMLMSLISECYIIRRPGKGSNLQTAPITHISDANPKSGLSPVLPTNRLLIIGSKDPSSGLMNLLEHLTELKGTFYLLDCWFTIKCYNSRTGRGKRCIGEGMGKGWGASMLSWAGVPLSPHLRMFTKLEAHQVLFKSFYRA